MSRSKKSYDKRLKMLKHPKSKVIILNTPESELMFELLQRVDKVFSQIRYKQEDIEAKDKIDIITTFKKTILKNSEILNMIADEVNVDRWETLLLEKLKDDLNQ